MRQQRAKAIEAQRADDAQQQGQPAAASIVLSVYAVGSCLAGIAFGAMRSKLPLPRLFLYGGVATAVTTLPLRMTPVSMRVISARAPVCRNSSTKMPSTSENQPGVE